jgi:hypothetical protein
VTFRQGDIRSGDIGSDIVKVTFGRVTFSQVTFSWVTFHRCTVFINKKSLFFNFWKALEYIHFLVYLTVIWYIDWYVLWISGKLCVYLVYISGFGRKVPKKVCQPCSCTEFLLAKSYYLARSGPVVSLFAEMSNFGSAF